VRFRSVDIAVVDPVGTSRWYRETLGAAEAGPSAVRLGDTLLRLHARDAPAANGRNHLAFRIGEEQLGRAVAAARRSGGHLPGDEGAEIQDWPFLSARAVYLLDPHGDILELIAPAGQRGEATDPEGPLAGDIVEVGLLVDDAAAAAALLQAAGLPVLGAPTAEFGFVGDLDSRLVLATPGRPWFPTGDVPPSDTVLAVEVADAAVPGAVDVRVGSVTVHVGP
jgi:catechol 2,3-dioxygenase-like lactoylglutathione lyase family enzyme